MGFSRKRTGIGGRVRYAAIYRDLHGRQRSAGSFATRREADRAWQRAEVMLGLGRVGDPARGRQTFEHYVVETWFPNHQVEVTTRQVYWYCRTPTRPPSTLSLGSEVALIPAVVRPPTGTCLPGDDGQLHHFCIPAGRHLIVATQVRRGEAACTAWIRLPFTDNAPYAWLPQWAGHRMVIQGSPITRLLSLDPPRK